MKKSKMAHNKIAVLHEMIGDCIEGTTLSSDDFEWAGDMLTKTYTMGSYNGSLTEEECIKANKLYKAYQKLLPDGWSSVEYKGELWQ